MIEDSQFYSKLSALESARQTGISNLIKKGVRISKNASIPSVATKILEMPSNVVQTQKNTINTSGSVVIIVAELPNTTIGLYDADGSLLQSKTTDATYGGPVTFSLTSTSKKTYTIKAQDSESTELWENTVVVDGIGTYNCKTGKAFADYTPEEVNTAAKNHYAKYMWSVGDERKITTLGSSYTWIIAGFEHDVLADSSNETAGMTLMMKSYYNTSYKHNSSNSNIIGWEGSLIRRNGLRAGDVYYLRATVTETTEGEYYVYDTELDMFEKRTLPDDYSPTEVYYTQGVQESDGAYITGLPDFEPYMLRVLKETADAGSGYKKIIKSMDNVFIPSDAEVFGNNNRYSRYSRYELEGKQYDYFKNNCSDGKIRLGNYWWLRSPYSGDPSNFCYVSSGGYAGYNYASGSNYVRLAFCL